MRNFYKKVQKIGFTPQDTVYPPYETARISALFSPHNPRNPLVSTY